MTDTNALGTKDGTSVVTPQSALKEAVERVTADVVDMSARDAGLFGTSTRRRHHNNVATDLRTILATLSSQSATLEAMASALEGDIATLRHTYDRLSDDWMMETLCLTINATIRETRTALSQYRSLNGDA